jgi:PAS domain S-box-containing protein
MQLALDAADIGTWEWFPKTGVMVWDERCRALFGMQPGAPVNYEIFLAAVHPDDRRQVEEQLQRNLAEEDTYRITFRSVGVVDGVQRWIGARGQVIARDIAGRAEHFVGTALDVTLREEAAEFRERFLGIVSHDLRNPLNAIGIGAAAMLRREETPPAVARLAGRIVVNVERMARMISDLLDVTRGRLGGGIPVSPQPIDLPAVAKTTLDMLKAAYPERQIVNEARGDLHGEWDPDRLGQVIGNLVGNACSTGTVRRRSRCSCATRGRT